MLSRVFSIEYPWNVSVSFDWEKVSMESSSSSKFRFRDHKRSGDSMDGGTSSDSSSVSSDGDDQLEVESMTGKVNAFFFGVL